MLTAHEMAVRQEDTQNSCSWRLLYTCLFVERIKYPEWIAYREDEVHQKVFGQIRSMGLEVN
jgi:hypothetical protein